MAHMETHPVGYSEGVHDGSLAPLRPLGQHGLRLGGLDPSDDTQWDAIRDMHPGGAQVVFSADSGDPQLDRDLVAIGRHTIWNGTNLWPGQTLQPEHFNMGANALRVAEGLPQEGPDQVPTDRIRPAPYLKNIQRAAHHIQSATDQLKDEMDSRVSKWSVVAFGELQQPGAVGTEQNYNPVTDGPNPNGPNFSDNAGNSTEQEQAVQTWVNMAIDMLNRGETADAVTAQLSHDGCPDPQGVLQRAMQQPQASPVSDEIGQDPFEVPPADPGTSGNMESVSQQPPVVTGKLRIKGTTLTGSEVERYEDTWGQGIVRIALDSGGHMNVSPDGLEDVEQAPQSAVSEVQAFIDGLPPVEPHRAAIETRIANLKEAKLYAMRSMKTSSFSEQVELDRLASSADEQIMVLRTWLRSDEALPETSIVTQAYRHNALELAPSTPDRIFVGSVREAAAIWAEESPYHGRSDAGDFQFAARNYAASLNMSPEQSNEFLHVAHERAGRKVTEAMAHVAATVENDGPAEALFI